LFDYLIVMKIKILNVLLIISSLFGYLEWGEGQHSFLFQIEAELFQKIVSEPSSVIHPFTVIPLIGQLLLLITVFQKKPNKILTYIGIGSLGLLLGFMTLIGIIGKNPKIFFSTIPFLVFALMVFFNFKKNEF
jgi:cobalamin biosynthesis protein CobD/CbiB